MRRDTDFVRPRVLTLWHGGGSVAASTRSTANCDTEPVVNRLPVRGDVPLSRTGVKRRVRIRHNAA